MSDLAATHDLTPTARPMAGPGASAAGLRGVIRNLRGLAAQPAVAKALPAIGLIAVIGLAAMIWMIFSAPPARTCSAVAGVAWARWWYEFWPERSVWIAFFAAPLSAVAVWAVVALAVRRPPVAELRIDPVLRARSARVPVGLGTAVLCLPLAGSQSGALYFWLAGLITWVAVANPMVRAVRV